MTCTYMEYITMSKAISFEKCISLHQDILDGIGNDEDAVEMYDFLIEKATEYVKYRSNWTTKDKDWKRNEDSNRTATHDALISNFNMLARYLQSIGKNISWRDDLGYVEDDPGNRKRIGDFACYLVFVHSLNGR